MIPTQHRMKPAPYHPLGLLVLLSILFGLTASPVMAETSNTVSNIKKPNSVPGAGKATAPKFEINLGLPALGAKDKKKAPEDSLTQAKNATKPVTFKPAVKSTVKAVTKPIAKPAAPSKTTEQALSKSSKPAVQTSTPSLKALTLKTLTLNGEEDLDMAFLFSTENPEFAPPKEEKPALTKAVKTETVKKGSSQSTGAPGKTSTKSNAMGPVADYLTEEEEESKIYAQMMSSVETKVAKAKAKRAADLRIAMGDMRTVSRGMFGTRGLGRVPLLAIPVHNAYISSRFGWRSGRPHHGIDLAANSGENIYASSQGTVTHSGWYGGYGNMILIDHGDGVRTLYGHCSSLLVSPGQTVKKGQVIGKVGNTGHSTGPHLHYEVLTNGVPQNPEAFLFR